MNIAADISIMHMLVFCSKDYTSSTATGFKQQLSQNNGSRRLTKKLHLLITEQMVKMMLIKISTVLIMHHQLVASSNSLAQPTT